MAYTYDSENIFARILRGEIPNKTVAETEHTLAFHDIAPQAPVHVLVIPKGPYVNFDHFAAEASPEEIVDFHRTAASVMAMLDIAPGLGYRTITNAGEHGHAGSAAFPHAYPRRQGRWAACSATTRPGGVDPAAEARLRRQIAARLPVEELPGPLRLRFHAARPESRLSELARLGGGAAPYWARLWPGGAALVAHIAARPETVRVRAVLDLGAGSGLVGIAAARAGAARVLASEVDPVAQLAMSLNAAENGVSLDVHGDLLDSAPPAVDLVLVGDLFYAADLARRVAAFLSRARAAGAEVLVGDIGRADLPEESLETLASYPVRDVGEPATAVHSGRVMRFLG